MFRIPATAETFILPWDELIQISGDKIQCFVLSAIVSELVAPLDTLGR
jgi:hypothetical protein